MPSLVDYDSINQIANRDRESYLSASPFPHAIIENLFSRSIIDTLIEAFPTPEESEQWRKIHVKHPSGSMQVGKLGLSNESAIPQPIRRFIWELNSAPFINFLEQLTGISNLIADPRLRGGGLHQVLPGGKLGVHADFTRHGMYKIYRRINLLLFLNTDWLDDYEGHLELWSKDVSRCEKRIRPSAGRCVIFNTDTDSYHGHPNPLNCPEGMTRKSLALYYYTNYPADKITEPTTATDWKVLPNSAKPQAI